MMNNKLTENILNKYPQLRNIFGAIKVYKETGKQEIKCQSCKQIIEIKENRKEGFLEANCSCGKSKYRMRWSPVGKEA